MLYSWSNIFLRPSGDWHPYGGDELEASAVGLYMYQRVPKLP